MSSHSRHSASRFWLLAVLIAVTASQSACGEADGAPGTSQGAPGPSGELFETGWVLTHQVGGGEAHVAVPVELGLTMLIGPGGSTVFGSSGCQNYLYDADVSDGALLVEVGARHDVGCPPGAEDHQDRFFANLAASDAYRLDGDDLHLLDEAGTLRATFARSEYAPFSTSTDTTAP